MDERELNKVTEQMQQRHKAVADAELQRKAQLLRYQSVRRLREDMRQR